MATIPPIQFKRSSTVGSVPLPADLLVGELALNLEDRKIYTKTLTGEVIVVGANYDSDIEISDSEIQKAVHEYLEADSDIRLDIDSDLKVLRGFDSDLRHDFDSDMLVLKAADSDNKHDLDSDIANLKLEELFNVSNEYDEVVSVPSTGDVVGSGWLVAGATYDGTYTAFQTNRIACDNATGTLFTVLLMPDTGRYTAYQKDNGNGTFSYAIPKSQENAAQNMVAGALTIEGWALFTASSDYFDPAATQNSNTGAAFPHNPIQANTLNPFDAFEQGTVTVADSATGLPINITDGASATLQLDPGSTTTVSTTVSQGQVLAFDSDAQEWRPADAATENKLELFTATQNQLEFTLTSEVKGDVLFLRNGVALDTTTYSIADLVVTYDPTANSNHKMRAGDKVMIQYTTLNK